MKCFIWVELGLIPNKVLALTQTLEVWVELDNSCTNDSIVKLPVKHHGLPLSSTDEVYILDIQFPIRIMRGARG